MFLVHDWLEKKWFAKRNTFSMDPNYPLVFTSKYGHLWWPIILPFGFWRTFYLEWQIFGMTLYLFFYFSQAMHEANALTKRILKYVLSVVFLSFLFTFTRFFEANVSYIDHDNNNLTEKIIALEPTEMRSNPIYTSYLNWSRLIVLGIIPFVLLVFLNASIYKVKWKYKKEYFLSLSVCNTQSAI